HFVDAVITFANYVYSRYNLKTVFIPMQKIYDYEISKQAVAKIESATILERDFSADELLGLCADAVFLAGMRLHSIIYAFKAGTPAIGIAYDPKVKAVIEEFGQKFCADVASVTAEQLKSFADEIIANRSVISAQISEKSAELAKKSFLNAECAVALLNENMF
ncbi:MAG: polysaccharide pyruvyl transferase family protein, partial [Clostridiales bacterium]|nr:polysaccharide pyruvyl transferase family protein [Clostridiales bacterium]